MVVRLDLHEKARGLPDAAVDPGLGVRPEPGRGPAVDDRGVVPVGGEHPSGVHRMGVPDHVEEGAPVRPAVHGPRRIEDLVPAMLGVRLREHHELGVGGIAAERAEALAQPSDFVIVERESESPVRVAEGAFRIASQGDPDEWPRPGIAEDVGGNCESPDGFPAWWVWSRIRDRKEAFGHAVVQRFERRTGDSEWSEYEPERTAFYPPDMCESAVPGDVRCLARPRRDGSLARYDQDAESIGRVRRCLVSRMRHRPDR